jgi:hypothetical protein
MKTSITRRMWLESKSIVRMSVLRRNRTKYMRRIGGTRRRGGGIDRVGGGDCCDYLRGIFGRFGWLNTVQKVSRDSIREMREIISTR